MVNSNGEYSTFLIYKLPLKDQLIIKEKFKILDSNLTRRQNIALKYEKEITNSLVTKSVHVEGQIYWRYNIFTSENNNSAFISYLLENEIWASSWYSPIAHLFFPEDVSLKPDLFKGANNFGKKVVNLFVDSRISEKKVYETIEIVNNFKP